MNSIVVAIIAGLVLLAALAVAGQIYSQLRRIYYIGIGFWSRWLPVVATLGYMAVLAANLSGNKAIGALATGGSFAVYELVILFLVGPFLLTRYGNAIAAGALIYVLKVMFVSGGAASQTLGTIIIVGCVTTVAILGDRYPWLRRGPNAETTQKLRDILLASVYIGSLGVITVGILKIDGFHLWLASALDIIMPMWATIIILLALVGGWLTVALGYSQHLTMAVLCLPSLLVLAYVTNWPPHVLVIPFALCMSLSLATAERRVVVRNASMIR